MFTMIVVYLIIGVLAGSVSGFLGIGGGIILVPALAFLLSYNEIVPTEIVMRVAAATALAVMVGSSLFAARSHYRHGYISWPLFRQLMPGLVLGAVLGVSIADFLDTAMLRRLFGLFLILISGLYLFPRQLNRQTELPAKIKVNLSCLTMGCIAGMLGLGGGVFVIPWLNYYGVPLRNTLGVGSVCSFCVALVGSIACIIVGLKQPDLPAWSSGYIYWPAAVGIVLASLFVTSRAARCAYRVSFKLLERCFGGMLLSIGIYMVL